MGTFDSRDTFKAVMSFIQMNKAVRSVTPLLLVLSVLVNFLYAISSCLVGLVFHTSNTVSHLLTSSTVQYLIYS